MLEFITIGILLGISAGFAPGPLLTLVIAESLQHGIKNGIKVAVAPIVTDLPIIIVSVFVLMRLSAFYGVLGYLSIFGCFFLLFMGYQAICTKGIKLDYQKVKTKSLAKGALVNVLSPHPYLFWITVGAPLITRALNKSFFSALFFLTCFYLMLVGSKILLAVTAGKFKTFINDKIYVYIVRFLGLLLVVLAIVLFVEGVRLLRIN